MKTSSAKKLSKDRSKCSKCSKDNSSSVSNKPSKKKEKYTSFSSTSNTTFSTSSKGTNTDSTLNSSTSWSIKLSNVCSTSTPKISSTETSNLKIYSSTQIIVYWKYAILVLLGSCPRNSTISPSTWPHAGTEARNYWWANPTEKLQICGRSGVWSDSSLTVSLCFQGTMRSTRYIWSTNWWGIWHQPRKNISAEMPNFRTLNFHK